MAGQLGAGGSREGIVTVTLRRPEALNALNTALCGELVAALEAVGRNPAARVLILTGEGRAFSAGADLKERAGASQDAIWRHNRVSKLVCENHKKDVDGKPFSDVSDSFDSKSPK